MRDDAFYVYAHVNRCVRETTETVTRHFVWDGWNIVATVDVENATQNSSVTYYVWGPDVSGTLQGAGGVGGLLAVIRPDGTFFPCYDGNMLTNGVWSYAWDAENRMTGAASNGVPAVSNAYDHRHRRVRKATVAGTCLFAYDGRNLTAEVFVDSQTGATNVTRYLWGPDLSGTLQGAGGVGGLLAVIRSDGTFFPCYDANGNVTDYVDAYGAVRGHFGYDAFGNTVAMWGDLAHTFKFRFSTKYWDDETRSYYYGYRFYSPELGRWLSKDLIGELGGLNLYGFSGNDAVKHIDYLGKLKKEFKKLAEGEMIFAGTFGSVEPGLILIHECKCKNVKYDLQFHYTLRMLSKADTEGWKETPNEYPGESLDNWGTWTINQKYAFILGHEEKHVYWWRVFFDATVTILEHQESQEFASYEACNKYSEQVIDGVYKAYDAYIRKQRMHYFWEAGH